MTLTREAIMTMPAGPEMDALVATLVLGLKVGKMRVRVREAAVAVAIFVDDDIVVDNKPVPYSTDIASAWEVVEKFRGARNLILNDGTHHPPTYEVQAGLDEHGPWTFCAFEMGDGVDARCARAETAPLAICRAALLTTLERSQS